MRNLYLKENNQNPTKISPFHQRSRLKSLKQLRHIPTDNIDEANKNSQQRIFQILQKKMIQDNEKLQNKEVIQNIKKTYPLIKVSKHTQKQQLQKKLANLKQGNKLFQYFEQLYRKQIPVEKVERQKVNFIEKQFEEIKTKVKTKQEINKIKLYDHKQNLRKKYLQLHKYHDQRKELDVKVRQQVKFKLIEEKNKKLKSQNQTYDSQLKMSQSTLMNLKPPSLKQKLYILDDTINFMKTEIQKIQEQIQNINTKEISIEQEWINFLKIFLNSAYYMSNGLHPILLELAKMKVILIKDDLTGDILDDNTKNYILRYYKSFNQVQKISSNIIIEEIQTKKFGALRGRIKSNIQMKSIIKDSNLKDIYSNTRQAVTNLLKRSSFRNSSQVKDDKLLFLPKIQTKKQFITKSSRLNTIQQDNQNNIKEQLSLNDQISQQRKQQINRINYIYFGNERGLEAKGRLIKRILFGFTVK